MKGTYHELIARWKALRSSESDLRVREVACVGAPRTLLCVERGTHDLPTIAIAAGVHGDEPAGPWALLALVESRALDPAFAYRRWPCTNPSGYEAGTRESVDGIDINRTFGRGGGSPEARAILTANRNRRFELSLDLHEDCDAAGFYAYAYGDDDLGRAVIRALEDAAHPIQAMDDYDIGSSLAGRSYRTERGLVLPNPVAEAAALGGRSYSLMLASRAARRALTFETPAGASWAGRLAMHALAVSTAIDGLSQTIQKVTSGTMSESPNSSKS